MKWRILFRTALLLIILGVTLSSTGQRQESSTFHIIRQLPEASFLKFQSEKAGRVAFLGGSITCNSGWRDSVCSYFQHRFPGTVFDFINAGIPSMGSTPGAFRFERDVLKNGPVDLLFLEAAVNDDTNGRKPEEIIRGMEGIVRHAKQSNPKIDIIFLYFVDPGKMEDYRAGRVPEVIRLHEEVAAHYSVSAINLAAEVTARIDNGEFDWEKDFRDLHPSPFGQQVYFNSIRTFLDGVKSGKRETELKLPAPIDPFSYENGNLIEPRPGKKIKGWKLVDDWTPGNDKNTRADFVNVPMLVGEYPGRIIKFAFRGNAVGIAVAAGPDAGIIEYSIDDSEWVNLDLFTRWSKNLYLPWFYTLGAGLKGKKHMLQIRMTNERNPESTGNQCVLRYFYVNEIEN